MLISLLVWVLVFALIAGIVYYILTLIPLPQPFKNIVMVCFLLIVLLVVLAKFLPMAGVEVP
jgi:hypothetical protein